MNEFKRKWKCYISSGLCFRISRERGNAFAFLALGAIAAEKHEAFAEKPIYAGVGGANGLCLTFLLVRVVWLVCCLRFSVDEDAARAADAEDRNPHY